MTQMLSQRHVPLLVKFSLLIDNSCGSLVT